MAADNRQSNLNSIISIVYDAANAHILKKAVLSKNFDKSISRVVIAQKLIGGKYVLQAECFYNDNKAKHINIPINDNDLFNSTLYDMFEKFAQINIITTAGDCEYKVSKSGNSVVLGADKFKKALLSAPSLNISGNDNEKAYILSGNEDFLKLLSISDENGRVFDKKKPKFRQINRFLENIKEIIKYLPSEGVLRVCDLCCGKSYLSFAAYYYLSAILKRDVLMTGVDLKSDVIEYCNSIARRLSFDGLDFVCMDINEYKTEFPPHLVISLHACDTATDTVLEKAVSWNTPVILSTPCCHHQLNHTLACPELSFIAEHSMLRQKFCDAATDALRLKYLQANLYKVAAIELIDPDDTPKNILLRAIKCKKTNSSLAMAKNAENEYIAAKKFLIRNNIL